MLSVLEHYKQHKHPLFVSMASGLEHSPCARGKNYHLLKKGTFRNCSQARSYCHEKARITTPSKRNKHPESVLTLANPEKHAIISIVLDLLAFNFTTYADNRVLPTWK